MDKEGQPIQFSSDKISEKQKPDFFVASNEKAERRKRFSPKTTFSKIGGFFKSLGVKLLDYFKHPFRGKHKIATIIGIIAIIVAIVLITLNITLWSKNTAKDPTPLSDEEMIEWGNNLSEIVHEASLLSDDDFKIRYGSLINDEKSEYKYIDLIIRYANELSYRAFVDQSFELLDALDIEEMECSQVKQYYYAYYLAYLAMGNGSPTSESEYYRNLVGEQEDICLFGEVISGDEEGVQEEGSNATE